MTEAKEIKKEAKDSLDSKDISSSESFMGYKEGTKSIFITGAPDFESVLTYCKQYQDLNIQFFNQVDNQETLAVQLLENHVPGLKICYDGETYTISGLNDENGAQALENFCKVYVDHSFPINLEFKYCQFTPNLAKIIANIPCTSIELLGDKNKGITTAIIQALAPNKTILALCISCNQEINDQTMEALCNGLPQLRYLHAANCNISDKGIKILVTHHGKALRRLDVRDNKGITDAAMESLADLPQLDELSISPNITDDGIMRLAKGNPPSSLNLNGNTKLTSKAIAPIYEIIRKIDLILLFLQNTNLSHYDEKLLFTIRNEDQKADPKSITLVKLRTNCYDTEAEERIPHTSPYSKDITAEEVWEVADEAPVNETKNQSQATPDTKEDKEPAEKDEKSSNELTVRTKDAATSTFLRLTSAPATEIKRTWERHAEQSPNHNASASDDEEQHPAKAPMKRS